MRIYRKTCSMPRDPDRELQIATPLAFIPFSVSEFAWCISLNAFAKKRGSEWRIRITTIWMDHQKYRTSEPERDCFWLFPAVKDKSWTNDQWLLFFSHHPVIVQYANTRANVVWSEMAISLCGVAHDEDPSFSKTYFLVLRTGNRKFLALLFMEFMTSSETTTTTTTTIYD